MKKILLTAAAVFVTLSIYAQGTVDFANNSSTLIRNGLTGAAATTANGIMVALYWAPISDPNNFTQIGAANSVAPSTFPLAGRFLGGTRETGNATTPGAEAWFMVKAWESAYGSTYEAALAAPAMNGRTALVGASPAFRLNTGGGGIPPSTPTSVLGTTANPGFTGGLTVTTVVPEPSIIALGLIGAGSLLLFRRRK